MYPYTWESCLLNTHLLDTWYLFYHLSRCSDIFSWWTDFTPVGSQKVDSRKGFFRSNWRLPSLKLTLLRWLAGKNTIWRCISYWTWRFSNVVLVFRGVPSLKLTVRIWKWMVGRRSGFLLGPGLFSGAFAVSFTECNQLPKLSTHFLSEVCTNNQHKSRFQDARKRLYIYTYM